ncbi:MAG: hypothetical protein M3O02_10330 [Acidobacteriota bacterium]|nr:hypothetical protein [Acidobacteriota bacterium]
MLRKCAVVVWFVALAACAAAGQQAAGVGGPEVLANGGLLHTLEAAPVVGAPYSAVQVSELVQTLSDGTKIHKGPGAGHAVMRDSAGRVRVERRLTKAANGDPGVVMVFVLDPVDHKLTTWAVGGKGEKTAMEIKLPAAKVGGQMAPAPAQTQGNSGKLKPAVSVETLAPEMLDGLPVDPVKTTTVIPAGRVGNETPITRVHETWTSPDMKLIVKEEWIDPRTGDLTVWLKSFSRAEPDAAMFRAPAGYKVKSMKETLEELQQKLAEAQGQM